MNLLQKFFHMTNKMKIHQLSVALKVILCWPTIATQKSFKLIDRKLWIYPNGFEQIIFFSSSLKFIILFFFFFFALRLVFFCFCVFELWFSFWKFVVQMMKQELLLNIQQRMHLCAHLMNWFIASGLHLYECYDLCICVLNCGSASPILQKPIENDYIY